MSKTRIVIEIDEDLKIKLKIKALKQKKSMKQLVTELIEEYVYENKRIR